MTNQPNTAIGDTKLYRVIYADPPWKRNQLGSRGAINHYKLMDLDAIKGMAPAIQALSATDAVLLLWVTNSGLQDGLDVVKAWGFRYVGNAVWDKYLMGLGEHFRGSHELLLVGVKGRAKARFHGQKSVLQFPRTAHSAKPTEMASLIERMYEGPYLELFARRPPNSIEDWDWWGDECDATISLAPWGYPVPSDKNLTTPGKEVEDVRA